jgi:hypothetical protein
MDTFNFVLFIFFAAIVIINIYIWNRRRKESRRREMDGWAFSHNLNFSAANDGEMEDRYPSFTCLQQGKYRYAYNVNEGSSKNRKVCAFDCRYDTSDGKYKRDYYFSAVVLDAGLPLKPLFIRSENFLDKVADYCRLR